MRLMKLAIILVLISLGIFSCEGGCVEGSVGGSVEGSVGGSRVEDGIDAPLEVDLTSLPVKYVAVGGDEGANNQYVVLSSPDGINWHQRQEGAGLQLLENVTYGGIDETEKWFAVSQGGYTVKSGDGKDWSVKEDSTLFSGLLGITFVPNNWIAVGVGFKALRYDDISGWSNIVVSNDDNNGFRGIAFDGIDNWVAVGDQGSILINSDTTAGDQGSILTNSDTTAYQIGDAANLPMFKSVTYGNGRWVAVGTQMWTTEGLSGAGNWNKNVDIDDALFSVSHNGSIFLAVGGNPGAGKGCVVYTSEDGNSWKNKNVTISDKLNGVTYGDNIWIAVGDGGVIYTSNNDAGNWTSRSSPTTLRLTSVATTN